MTKAYTVNGIKKQLTDEQVTAMEAVGFTVKPVSVMDRTRTRFETNVGIKGCIFFGSVNGSDLLADLAISTSLVALKRELEAVVVDQVENEAEEISPATIHIMPKVNGSKVVYSMQLQKGEDGCVRWVETFCADSVEFKEETEEPETEETED